MRRLEGTIPEGGVVIGGCGDVPYGFKAVSRDVKWFVADEGEQAIIQAAHELKEQGLSLRQIGTELAERGMLPRSGRAWHPESGSNLLKAWKGSEGGTGNRGTEDIHQRDSRSTWSVRLVALRLRRAAVGEGRPEVVLSKVLDADMEGSEAPAPYLSSRYHLPIACQSLDPWQKLRCCFPLAEIDILSLLPTSRTPGYELFGDIVAGRAL